MSLRFAYVGSALFFLLLIFYYAYFSHRVVFGHNAFTIGIKKGIYSGTFDPPTKAHNAIIRNSITTLGLEKLYIFVNKNNTKDCKCSMRERIEMLKIMLADLKDKVVIIPQVSDKKCDDYFMIKSILNEKLVLITGEDSYQKRLLIQAHNNVRMDALCIIPRELGESVLRMQLEQNAFYAPFEIDEKLALLSSTKIRQQLANKCYKNIGLTPEVLNYVLKKRLYSSENKDEKNRHYLEKYYAYVGKSYASCSAPKFDPVSSEDSWQEKFQKWTTLQSRVSAGKREVECNA